MERLFVVLTHAVESTPAVALAAAFAWGILSVALSPCHLSSIPLIVGFISGQGKMTPRQAFWISTAFAVGILATIGLIGAITASAGRMIGDVGPIGNYIVAAIIFGICFGIGLILCIVPGIIIGLIWMFYGFVIVENPNTTATDALKKSQEMTKGRLGELFVFGLALFGINLIGAILCGVGLLFTYGISAIAVAYAYRSLRGEPVAPIA